MSPFEKFVTKNWYEIAVTAGILFGYIVLRSITKRLINRHANRNDLHVSRSVYVSKVINFFLIVTVLISTFAIWNLKAKFFLGFFGSFFTIAGVALFAQWSLLSNITASVLLFFSFPFKIGSRVRIMDDKNSVEGIVLDITFFVIQILTDEGNVVSYPNNLAIQKGIVEFKNYTPPKQSRKKSGTTKETTELDSGSNDGKTF